MANNDAINPEKANVVYNVVGQPVQKRVSKEPSCWISSPGNFKWLREGERLLTSIGINGQPVNQVDYVRAAYVLGTKTVYIFPTSKTDPDAIAVKRRGKRVTLNLSDEMIRWQIALPINTAARFRLLLSAADDPVYPAVKLDAGAPLEIRSTKKGSKGGPSEDVAAGEEPSGTPEPEQS